MVGDSWAESYGGSWPTRPNLLENVEFIWLIFCLQQKYILNIIASKLQIDPQKRTEIHKDPRSREKQDGRSHGDDDEEPPAEGLRGIADAYTQGMTVQSVS